MSPWDLRNPSTWNRNVPTTLNRNVVTVNGTTGLPQIGNGITHVVDQAVYAGTTWGFFHDDLLILCGIRRTDTSLQNENDYNTDPAILPWAVRRTIDPEFKAAKTTPQLGVLYKLRRDISLFASYSESFVPAAGTLGMIDKSDPNNWTMVPGAAIKPTEGSGYDFGVKTDLFDGRASSTITYFDVKNENIVTTIPQTGPNGIFFPTFQSGLQESKGIEMDFTISPTDHWQIYASASFMDAKIVYVANAAEDARMLAINTYAGYLALNAADRELWKNVWRFHDKPLQMTAPETYNLWTKYTFTGAMKGFFVGGGANFVRDQTIFPETEVRNHQTYTLWNCLVGYSTKVLGYQTTFTLTGKNLTNEEYLPSQNTQSRPREFLFSVTTRF
jgi:iron complex outermembrane receptor protein